MSDWLTSLSALARRNDASVLVTVAETKGSVPREAGTKMVVTRGECLGTIGGGHLEFKAIELAREMLIDARQGGGLRRFALGPSLGQCCGGVAVLLFEPINATASAWIDKLLEHRRDKQPAVMVTPIDATGNTGKLIVTVGGCFGALHDAPLQSCAITTATALLDIAEPLVARIEDSLLFEAVQANDFHIVLFGAGHVGKALVSVLSGLPCTITWVDSRADEFPTTVPANVSPRLSDEPDYEIDDTPSGSYILIMTHSHPLDQAICERALLRADFAYCGLIGSSSKLKKFQKRMLARGLAAEALAGLTCPIGVDGISGKHPAEIAIAVAAQLLQVRERRVLASARAHAAA